MYNIGVDIGATKTKFVLMAEEKVVKTQKVWTSKNQKGIIESLEAMIEELTKGLPRNEIKGVGIGVPGLLTPERDFILNLPNLPEISDVPLAKVIEKDLKIKTVMENDANCFTLAEALLGAGKNSEIVLGVTLGTGVGGGLVMGKKIYQGAFGAALELGHTSISYDGPKCSCGNRGCLEEYASERFFLRKGAHSIESQKKAGRKNKKALQIYKEYGKYLGIGLSNAVNILDPNVVVLGGGIANGFKFFISETKKEVKKRVISIASRNYVRIKKAELGDWSGAVGAALLIDNN